ncbi:hypothetical protein Pcinc_038366 [Petrolisthes cinctipes]|uniref:Uncharacterized protein n=1 Tax=Petrolisthes cinctipes TaxID=88211 RepID=A0AAE1BR50_PETCI|nr:hypothetical protein Pcinc_038366 [Petrolisthes cinctipes]
MVVRNSVEEGDTDRNDIIKGNGVRYGSQRGVWKMEEYAGGIQDREGCARGVVEEWWRGGGGVVEVGHGSSSSSREEDRAETSAVGRGRWSSQHVVQSPVSLTHLPLPPSL